MAGHTVTPYGLTATRKFTRDKKKRAEPLILASLAEKETVDLLDVVSANVMGVDPIRSGDSTRSTLCVAARRMNDRVEMVFACEFSGEREVVLDPDAPGRPVIFTKGEKHVARYLSCCVLWRPASEAEGILLIHSPWGRGGSKSHILKLIQRAVDANDKARAKLHADPKIPADVLERILRHANAIRVTYTKQTGITSDFSSGSSTTAASAPAEIELVVRGADSLPFRDAFQSALRRKADRSKLLTVKVSDGKGGYEEEQFDDVEVVVETAGGQRTYSIARDTIPTMGFNITAEMNGLYYGLPEGGHPDWPEMLMEGASGSLVSILDDVKN